MKNGKILMWPVYFTKQKPWRAFVLPLLLIVVMACLLVGCSEKPQPLSGVYAGRLPEHRNNAYVLTFSKAHPGQIGIVKNFYGKNVATVFPITYRKGFFTIHTTTGADDTFVISKNRKTLTCLSCRSVDTPRTYQYEKTFEGKPWTNEKIETVFEAVVKHAKKQANYYPTLQSVQSLAIYNEVNRRN